MKKVLIGLGIVIIGGAAFFIYQNSQAQEGSSSTAVEMYKVEKQTPLHLKGQVQATDTQTLLLSSEKGPLQTIHVNEGDRVAKDTVLVTYTWGEKVKATRDSIVTTLNRDAENDSSKPLMILKSTDSEIRGTVTEYDKEKLAKDQPVTIEYVNQDKTVAGRITDISEINNDMDTESTSASIVTYNFTAQPNEAIPVGYSVEILIPRDEIHLPTKSVQSKDGQNVVYTVEKKKAKEQKVTVEKVNGYYLVKDGISEGSEIIKDTTDIKNGMDVSVQ